MLLNFCHFIFVLCITTYKVFSYIFSLDPVTKSLRYGSFSCMYSVEGSIFNKYLPMLGIGVCVLVCMWMCVHLHM